MTAGRKAAIEWKIEHLEKALKAAQSIRLDAARAYERACNRKIEALQQELSRV